MRERRIWGEDAPEAEVVPLRQSLIGYNTTSPAPDHHSVAGQSHNDEMEVRHHGQKRE
jgi:hypothetical protein